ncbi:MAG: aminotransferase class I/II-fold pyridoxal phosphate-dependent enzyme [Opitutales bacterium]
MPVPEPSERFPKYLYMSVPHMSGREMPYVQEAFESNWLSSVGPNLQALEAAFQDRFGAPCVALSSGTAAIHLGLRLLGVGPGDEVVVPTLTFAASANPVLYLGGTPVFIDSEPQSWNLDPNLLKDFLSKRASQGRLPKAVVVVHLLGQSADLDPILEVCNQYEVPVLEDAAEALGTLYKDKAVGVLGDVGVFSFNGNKIITSTGGGLLISKNAAWVEKARFWSQQARDPGINYLHSEMGYNYRMSNVLAGIARGQLEVLDERIEQRRAIAFRYRDAFEHIPGIALMPQASYGFHINWLSSFTLEPDVFGMNQRELIDFLKQANVETRPVWKPLHTQKLFQGNECVGGAVAEDLNKRGICLPSSSSLSPEEQLFIIERVIEAHELSQVHA